MSGTIAGRRTTLGILLLAAVAAAGCAKETTGPQLPVLEVVVAGGDGQHGTAGTQLPQPLRVAVLDAGTKLPVEDVTVRWFVMSGDARVVGPDAQVTGETGIVETTLELGTTEGEITVEASVVEQQGAATTLTAFLVGVPGLASVQPTEVTAGSTIVLDGENFSTLPDQNLVYFSEVRARVLAASRTRLEVEVPLCLPEREGVPVRVALGSVSSESVNVNVTAGGPVEPLDPGEHVDLDDARGLSCLRLSGEPIAGRGAGYLVLPHSVSTVSGASYPFRLRGMLWLPPATAPLRAAAGGLAASTPAPGEAAPSSTQTAFEAGLRAEEATLVEQGGWATGPALRAPRAPAAVPVEGTTRTFWVFNGGDDPSARFDEISATARHVGAQAVIYVDDTAPDGGLTDDDLVLLGSRFDEVIHPRVTGSFGSPSDLDGNDRVVILLTPVVNRLTEPDSDSFVGGFFFGRDLNPDLTGSNGGEVFYALVPDPDGEHGDVRTRAQVLGVIPAILAHEFQHMVHFNERVLLRGASQDAVWVLEALAQMAEELVARDYEAAGDQEAVALFREGNRRRAQLYLERPDTVSLVASSGSGTLRERGAGFLFLLYLHQQHGDDLVGRLTRQTRTGVAGVEAETARSWGLSLSDWMTSLFLELYNPQVYPHWLDAVDPALTYPGLELGDFIQLPSPLRTLRGGGRDFLYATDIASSSAEHILLWPSEGGTLTLAFGGEEGGPLATGSGATVRVLRLQ